MKTAKKIEIQGACSLTRGSDAAMFLVTAMKSAMVKSDENSVRSSKEQSLAYKNAELSRPCWGEKGEN